MKDELWTQIAYLRDKLAAHNALPEDDPSEDLFKWQNENLFEETKSC